MNWGKVAAVAVAALMVLGAGYYVYATYIYKPPPVYAKITIGYDNGTSLGTIEVELFPSCAPKTVASFVNLSQTGFYNNLVWHRIVKGFVIQTGDPNTRNGVNSTRSSWGQGGSHPTVPLEICSWLHNDRGYLGIARSTDPNSGSSQFYVNLVNNTSGTSNLDGNYTVFGRVISGMNIVDQVAKVPVEQPPKYPSQNQNQPVTPIFMTSVTIQKTP